MGVERQQVKERFEVVLTQNGQKRVETFMQNFFFFFFLKSHLPEVIIIFQALGCFPIGRSSRRESRGHSAVVKD